MMSEPYRPWGLLTWVLGKAPSARWSLLGGLSPEDRSLTAWRTLSSAGCLQHNYMAVVEDPPSRFTAQTTAKLSDRIAEFTSEGGDPAKECHGHELFAKHAEIVDIVEGFIGAAGPNVILDITSLPKRYFFPMANRLLLSRRIDNLLATYTRPTSYTPENLAENFEPLQYLPLFAGIYPERSPKVVVVGVGYQIMGLPEQLEHYGSGAAVKLLFPFPPGPPSFQRNWEFVRVLNKSINVIPANVVPIAAWDAADAFDHILSFTEHGRHAAAFAPYGPKPISLAMCVYATLTDSPVHYTQPKAYNDRYSSGVATVRGVPETYAYCLRLEGKNLYGPPEDAEA